MQTGVLNRNGVVALGFCAVIAGCGVSLQDPTGDTSALSQREGLLAEGAPAQDAPEELAPDSDEYELAKMALVGTSTQDSEPVPGSEPALGTFAEPLAAASAIVQDPGCLALTLNRTDDGSTGRITLPFSINFFGTTQNSLFINNNGNVTFNAALSTFTPFTINAVTPPIIAPFFADVDTRNAASGVVQFSNAPILFGGRRAFCVNWVRVGYFSNHADKLNSSQLLVVDRNDTGVNNFDIVMNYDQILWETGDASGGINGFGGTPAGAGFSGGNGNPTTFFQFPGSLVRSGLLDSNGVTGLTRTSHFTTVVGRHIFSVRSGQPITDELITLAPVSAPVEVGASIKVSATVVNDRLQPLPNRVVTFRILSGPNVGLPPTVVTTDSNGQASFAYDGIGGIGQDQIQSSFVKSNGQTGVPDVTVVNWVITAHPPVARCQNITLVSAANTCGVSGSINNGSFDPDGDLVECTQNPGPVYGFGSTLVTLTCTDQRGLTGSCTGLVTVQDTTAPRIICASGQTAECTGGHSAVVNVTNAIARDVCTSVAVTGPAGTSLFPLGTTTLSFDAEDLSGNRATCTTSVTVVDTTAPAIACAAPIAAECTGNSSATVNVPNAIANDVCGGVAITGPAGTASFSLGTTGLGFAATDDVGNTTGCATSVTVVDTTTPTITCPASIAAECTSDHAASVNVPNATASDLCSGVVVSGPAGTSSFPTGTTSIGFTAADTSGNTVACATDITVADTTAPAITCAAPITAECTGNHSATVDVANATASDVCGGVAVTGPAGAASYLLGTTALGFGATDDFGNRSSCATRITVADTTRPDIVCPAPITAECTGNTSAAVDVPNATASDVCGGVIVTGPAGTVSYSLGSTALGFGAFDDAGNTAGCATSVTIVDTTVPTLTCPAPITAECTGDHAASVDVPNATASDLCSGVAVTGPAGTSSFPTGTTSIGFTAADISGNTVACTTAITVADTTAPAITCAAPITAECTGNRSATVDVPNATASDVCGGVAVTGPAGTASFSLGTTALGFGAADDFGNRSSCATSVTVADTRPPVFDPASLGTRTVLGNCDGTPVRFTLPTATDSCQSVGVTCTSLPGNSFGANSVTCTATDGSGNHTAATITVNVLQPLRLAFQSPLSDDNVADDINTDADVSNLFEVKRTIPNQIKVFACNGTNVTTALAGSVTLRLTVNFRNDTSSGAGTSIIPNFTGVGDAGGVFVLTGDHFHYNQKTDPATYPAGSINNDNYFDNVVTLTYNFAPSIVAGQEDARLESK